MYESDVEMNLCIQPALHKRVREMREILHGERLTLAKRSPQKPPGLPPPTLYDFSQTSRPALVNPVQIFASTLLVLMLSFQESNPGVTLNVILGDVAGSTSEQILPYDQSLLDAFGPQAALLQTCFSSKMFRAAYCVFLHRSWFPQCLRSVNITWLEQTCIQDEDMNGYSEEGQILHEYHMPGMFAAVARAEFEYGRDHQYPIIPVEVWTAASRIARTYKEKNQDDRKREMSRIRFEAWKNSPERWERPEDVPTPRPFPDLEAWRRWPEPSSRRHKSRMPSSH
ncbi:hypothetical protein CYLTODRAFT_423216 [Cylindrobasidium torrendii FP15055 ss-10]|uniref:Uncharacterized protein n=1 Tax=Cylindrobasidium torrendii FP15055 ss-10 TaxID=1314674 RepID=A0A0D7B8Z7_9AGAR|nr:hypothetical protein CYLTODRAFT_423216 [Cylindrobasidium torrendii FP15055 ss-10]